MRGDGRRDGGLTEAQRQALRHVAAARSAGMSLRAYSRAHGLDVGCLYRANHAAKCVAKRPEAMPAVRLRRAEVVEAGEARAGTIACHCRVHLPNGVLVELGATTGLPLAELLQAAGSLS